MNSVGRFHAWPVVVFLVALPQCAMYIRKALEYLYLPWPGRQILPGILQRNGALESDLVAESAQNSPYLPGTWLLDSILPDNPQTLVATYSAFSLIFQIVSLSLGALAIYKFACYANYRHKLGLDERNYAFFLAAMLAVLVQIRNSPFDGSIPLPFTAANVAVWRFPMNIAAYQGGIASAIVSGLLIFVLGQLLKAKSFRLRHYILCVITMAASAIIHPVAPFMAPVILGAIWLCCDVKNTSSPLLLFSISSGLGCVIGALSVTFLFPQHSVPIDLFYETYVTDRHPHHYLPSYYFPASVFHLTLNGLLAGAILYFAGRSNARKAFLAIFVTAFLLLAALNIAQFLLVEKLKIYHAIAFGFSRLSPVYSFLFIASIAIASVFFIDKYHRTLKKHLPKSWLQSRFLRPRYLSVSAVAVMVASSFFVFFISKTEIKDSIPNQISHKVQEKHPGELFTVVSELPIPYFREAGNLAVYHDNYFPFSTEHMLQWRERGIRQSRFFECTDDLPAEKCLKEAFGPLKNGILVVTLKRLEMPEQPVTVDFKGNTIFAYPVSQGTL